MAGTINYLYDPNQVVWVIAENECENSSYVIDGTVIRVRGEVLVTLTEIKYDINLNGSSGTDEFIEADIFADLATAIAEYQIRLAA